MRRQKPPPLTEADREYLDWKQAQAREEPAPVPEPEPRPEGDLTAFARELVGR